MQNFIKRKMVEILFISNSKKKKFHMPKTILITENELKVLIENIIFEYTGQKAYADISPSKTSAKTGGYGGANVHRGDRGGRDIARGDKEYYYNGVPTASEISIVDPETLNRKKIIWFKGNAANIESSRSLFQDYAEMGWEMNNLQSATKGNVQWKIVTDDKSANQKNNPNMIRGIKHQFWLWKLPDEKVWHILKPNASGRYIDEYNPTTIKRRNV